MGTWMSKPLTEYNCILVKVQVIECHVSTFLSYVPIMLGQCCSIFISLPELVDFATLMYLKHKQLPGENSAM